MDVLQDMLISQERLAGIIERLAREVAADLEGKNPVFICILKGAVYFFAELTRRLGRSVVIDFIQVSSYGRTTRSSGTVTLVKDVTVDIADRDVYVVEDIVDTGLTLTDVIQLLRARHPRSVKIVTLLSKPSRRQVPVDVDFAGAEIDDRFVVGYGLDFDEQYRNLTEIWEFVPDQEG